MNTNDDLASEWDALLEDGLIEPPADFNRSVMRRVHEVGEPVAASSMITTVANALQFAAVFLGILAAGWQALGFIFGLWVTSVAL